MVIYKSLWCLVRLNLNIHKINIIINLKKMRRPRLQLLEIFLLLLLCLTLALCKIDNAKMYIKYTVSSFRLKVSYIFSVEIQLLMGFCGRIWGPYIRKLKNRSMLHGISLSFREARKRVPIARRHCGMRIKLAAGKFHEMMMKKYKKAQPK